MHQHTKKEPTQKDRQYEMKYTYSKKIQTDSNKGFTLIELLVVIAIIGTLASVVLASLNTARTKAADSKRLAEMQQIVLALEFYYDENGRYPSSDTDGCGGWDIGNTEYELISGGLGPAMQDPPEDATATGNCSGYRYYRYGPGSYGCSGGRAFYVLGVVDLETSGRPHPNSPGWSCPSRNWQGEFDWVTGEFES
jgi:prepilin-type N-terminal cleavage/methylation domain-containing protein